MDQHRLAARQFGQTAANYLTSPIHAAGPDLERLVALAGDLRPGAALDLGCGGGHVAFALARARVGRIVAYDYAEPMLAVVAREADRRGHDAICTQQGPAERLPFDEATFDLVVSRFSAHHWLSVPQALAQAARVLTPGGVLVMIDTTAPESPLLDTILQTLEVLRDLSHVRNYRHSEWLAMLQTAGFRKPVADTWKISLDFDSWVQRIGTPPPRVDALRTLLADLPSEARDYFAIAANGSFRSDVSWFQAARGSQRQDLSTASKTATSAE